MAVKVWLHKEQGSQEEEGRVEELFQPGEGEEGWVIRHTVEETLRPGDKRKHQEDTIAREEEELETVEDCESDVT